VQTEVELPKFLQEKTAQPRRRRVRF
jgi:hypothetical protein